MKKDLQILLGVVQQLDSDIEAAHVTLEVDCPKPGIYYIFTRDGQAFSLGPFDPQLEIQTVIKLIQDAGFTFLCLRIHNHH